jgi:arsenite methyltransferase
MTTLQIFDRPMCCSTGVCGPTVDPVLPRFAADLEWVKGQGVAVERYNLAQDPTAFTRYEDVQATLQNDDVACLPLFRVDGAIIFKGDYPPRLMLAEWCGLKPTALPITGSSCCGSTGCC